MTYHNLMLALVAVFALAAVLARNLLHSAIMLALSSVAVSLVLFDFGAPWAAVFELSVCAGLITVLFVGAVSVIRHEEEFLKEDRTRFLAVLPVTAIAAIAAWFYGMPFFEGLQDWAKFSPERHAIGTVIWGHRRFDLVGQIAILAAGVFVIKALFPAKKAVTK